MSSSAKHEIKYSVKGNGAGQGKLGVISLNQSSYLYSQAQCQIYAKLLNEFISPVNVYYHPGEGQLLQKEGFSVFTQLYMIDCSTVVKLWKCRSYAWCPGMKNKICTLNRDSDFMTCVI